MRRTIIVFISMAFVGFWLFLHSPLQLRAPDNTATISPEQLITHINLMPYNFRRFTSVVPQNWGDAGNGAFAYADTDYAIVQRAITAPSRRLVQPSMTNQLNLIEENFIEERQINSLTWQIYHGISSDFAIAYAVANGKGWTVYLVLMQVPDKNFNQLQEELFLATLAQFKPVD